MIYVNGKVLIVRRSKGARGDFGTWELPGGRLEFGETPEQALCREVIEEVGIAVDILRPLDCWSFLKEEDTQIIGVTYLCKPQLESVEVQLSNEHTEYSWISEKDWNGYEYSTGVEDAIRNWNWELLERGTE